MLWSKKQFLHYQETPPAHLLPWLTHTESLTMKLLAETDDYKLQILKQYWSNPLWWHRVSGLEDKKYFSREIIMQSLGLNCWYARSFISQSCFDLEPDFFARLEKEYLGALLFDEPKMKRDTLFHYQITPACLEYYWLKKWLPVGVEKLWARFASYKFLQKGELLLIEILLPGLEEING